MIGMRCKVTAKGTDKDPTLNMTAAKTLWRKGLYRLRLRRRITKSLTMFRMAIIR